VERVPRRLLILNTDLELGGTPTVVREIAMRLHAPPDTWVEVACLGKWGPVADQIRHAGIEVTALGAKGISDLWVVRHLIDRVRERRIDTVFSFLMHANAIAAAAKPACPKVRFFQSIQTTQAYPAWHWQVQRFVHHAAERIIVPSPSVARVAEERARVPPEKITIIPNAIDPAAFEPSPVPAANPRPYPIGFVGRLDPVKMVPDLVQAVGELGDLVHLHVFGDGPERESIARLVRLMKLEKRVTLHGFVPRPQDAMARIGALVLPSISEGMPMVLIEAMAAGVPVLGRDVPGVRDVIQHDVNGVLVKGLGIKELTEGIRGLVLDPARRERLVHHAREWVRAQFTWDQALAKYRTVLGLTKK
jgi:glycosyltransferase involved in cell wall biosynthesis